MRFWDSSAIVPLLIAEPSSGQALSYLKEDGEMLVWTLTTVECYSALFRRVREKKLAPKNIQTFRERLLQLEASWAEIENTPRVKTVAERLLAVHTLKAADSLQLAAAIVAFEDMPRGAMFLTFDKNLAAAAVLEGFIVL